MMKNINLIFIMIKLEQSFLIKSALIFDLSNYLINFNYNVIKGIRTLNSINLYSNNIIFYYLIY
jgi:hypothetical protein